MNAHADAFHMLTTIRANESIVNAWRVRLATVRFDPICLHRDRAGLPTQEISRGSAGPWSPAAPNMKRAGRVAPARLASVPTSPGSQSAADTRVWSAGRGSGARAG